MHVRGAHMHDHTSVSIYFLVVLDVGLIFKSYLYDNDEIKSQTSKIMLSHVYSVM